MRFARYATEGRTGLAVAGSDERFVGLIGDEAAGADALVLALAEGSDALGRLRERLLGGSAVDLDAVEVLPPIPNPSKIICVGLNYADHTAESGFAKQPDYPTLFGRFASSLIGHKAPMIRPRVSEQLDYEGEIVAVIGRGGRHIPKAHALDHVGGYALFNEGSVRDYQFKAPQWTVGKNFDATGAFGPYLVTADELPPGCKGLRLRTRLNGTVMQDASTDDMVFDVATLVATISEAITLNPGDLIVTGTPSGVGLARKPPLFMKPGDVCEVEVEGLGVLVNPVEDETGARRAAA
jgi:acylpyruvate hydrolase